MSQSRRANGRIRDLREHYLTELRAHTPLTTQLEAVDSIEDGTDAIMPASALDVQHRADTVEPPDAAIALMAVTGSSNRENRQARKNHVVQTDFQIRSETMRAQGPAWLDATLDEIAAVMTSHYDGWRALGVTGGTPEPLFDDSINRFRSVNRFDIEHWG